MAKKRMTALLTALVMLFSLFPVDVRADGESYIYDSEHKELSLLNNRCLEDMVDDTSFNRSDVLSVKISAAVDGMKGISNDTGPLLAGEFDDFTSLVSISVVGTSNVYDAEDGVLYGSFKGSRMLICYPAQKSGSVYVLPHDVTWIAENSFVGAAANIKVYSDHSVNTIGKIRPNGSSGELIVKSGEDKIDPVTSLKLDTDSETSNIEMVDETAVLHLTENETGGKTLGVIVTPADAMVTDVLWRSSDESIATVSAAQSAADSSGIATVTVFPHSQGSTTITAETVGRDNNGNHLSVNCTVVVKTPVSEIIGTPSSSSEQPLEIDIGAASPATLSATINADATDGSILWTSGNSGIATLSASADTTEDGYKTSTVEVEPQGGVGNVTVTASADGETHSFYLHLSNWVHSVSLPTDTLYLSVGDTKSAGTPGFDPADATDKTVTWSSSSDAIAAVNAATGSVTAVAPGTATITATAKDHTGEGASDVIATRIVQVRSLTITPSALELEQHDTATLTAEILPAGSDTVKWSVTKGGEYVSVDADTGVVTANELGQATVTATMVESGLTADCTVSVVEHPVQSVAISGAGMSNGKLTLNLSSNETPATAQLTATLNPTNATERTLNWSSTNPAVVSVNAESVEADSNGQYTVTITALAEGEADIVVNAGRGAKTAICHVLVPIAAKSLTLNKETLRLGPGGSEKLIPNFGATPPTDTTLTWTCTPAGVVTVDSDGTVAVDQSLTFAANESAHVATVTATTANGLSASCIVYVERNKVTSVSLDKTSLSLNLTDDDKLTGTLTATVNPDSATFPDVSWQTSNSSVATVTKEANGNKATVKAVAPGTATITVTTADLGYTANCTVTVAPTRVSAITLKTSQPLNLDLENNKTGTVTVEVTPHAATNRTVIWHSSNTEIVTVADAQTTANELTGLTSVYVAAKGAGSATVTATTLDGAKVAECTVNVADVPVTGVTVTPGNATLTLGLTPADASATLRANVDPSNATLKGVTWHSSDEDVVKVTPGENNTATIVAYKSGNATVTALSADGATKGTCAVTVRWNSTGVEITPSSASLAKGSSLLLSGKIITADDDANLSLGWSTGDSSIATVDANGRVTAVGVGSTTITATVNEYPDISASCEVTVTQSAQTLTLNETTYELSSKENDDNHNFGLVATLTPADVTDEITWSVSGDAGVVELGAQTDAEDVEHDKKTSTVSVTAKKGGAAVVTVQVGSKTASCNVTVPTPVTGVSVNRSTLSLGIGQDYKLSATLEPYDASDRVVSWSIPEGTTEIELAEDGTVTAKAVGTAVVTVKTHDGGFTKTCTVTVEPTAATGVSIQLNDAPLANDRLTLTMLEGSNTATLKAVVAPSDATDKSVTWTTDRPTVANVGQDGVVTAVAPGEAVISVETTSGGHRAVCFVTVEKTAVTGIDGLVSALELSLTDPEHKTGTLSAVTKPTDATEKKLIWSVDKPLVELSAYETTGDANDTVTVTARKPGTAIITVRAKDDPLTVYKTCTVTIPSTPVASLTLVKPPDELTVGNSRILSVTVTGENDNAPTNAALRWISSKPSVASVEYRDATSAVVTALTPGDTTITVTATDGSGVSANCKIQVYATADGLNLNKTSTTLTMGSNETETLIATVLPADGAKQTVTWTVSEGDAVSVDDNGKITALKAGTATVTATSTENSAAYKSCIVTVVQPTESVDVTEASVTLKLNGEAGQDVTTLHAALTPANASAVVVWSSDNVSVATVDSKTGVVTAVGKGTANITASSGGKSDSCEITVEMLASDVELNKGTLSIEKGRSATLIATVTPANASAVVVWSSDNVSVATVDQHGVVKVKADAADNATATIRAAINGHTAECVVTAIPVKVTGFLTQPAASLTIARGETGELTALVEPADAANRTILWSSDTPSVAAVQSSALNDETGVSTAVISAVAVGSATITAQTEDGSFVARCEVTVPNVGATSISLNQTSATLYRNIPAENETFHDSAVLTAAPLPAGTTDAVSWHSTNTGVATVAVNSNGTATVSAVAGGKATIVATTTSGESAQCVVTVKVLANSLSLSPETLKLEAGKTATLTPVFNAGTYADVSDPKVTWSSGDESVATVVGGVVTAVAVGEAVITATAQDGSGKTATRTVTVTPVAVTGVSLTPKTLTLHAGDTANLNAALAPANAANQNVTWDSDNKEAVTVENGTVTAVKAVDDHTAASATITVTTADGHFTDTCTVTVQPTAVTSLKLTQQGGEEVSALTIPYADRATNKPVLTAGVLPATATNQNVAWGSSNTTVATVTAGEDGRATVTAQNPGVAIITARSASDATITATCTITVTAIKVTGVNLNKPTLALDVGGNETLTATVEPNDANDPSVTWSSSNPTVASVDQNGKVSANSKGVAVIFVTTADGGKSAQCTVTVTKKATGVTLSSGTLSLTTGGSAALTATVSGDPSDASVTWTVSEGSDFVDVDENGTVTAKKAGAAKVTATAADGSGKTATCNVTVTDVAVTGVTLNRDELTLTVGGNTTVSAVVSPANATSQTVTWDSSDTGVATVDQNGKITAKAAGTADITATAGGVTSAKCAVTVYAAATVLTIKNGNDAVSSLSLAITENAPRPTASLTAVLNSGADPNVTWSSSNTDVATVTGGSVTALATGSATITATSVAAPAVKNTCVVTVTKPATGLTLTPSSASINLTADTPLPVTLTASVTPGGSTDTVTWSVNDATVVQLSATGGESIKVYGLKAGTATVTARCGTLEAKTCAISVTAPAKGILLDQAALTLAKNGTAQLTATVFPAGSEAVTIDWSSTDSTVATVAADENGMATVTAVKAGLTTVKASITADDTTYSASCSVTVTPILVSSLTLNEDALSVAVGSTSGTLVATVGPNTADNPAVTWNSSNKNVATVDSNGVISAESVGTTIITASAADGSGMAATCLVTVTPIAVEKIALGDDATLAEGENMQLTVTYTPAAPSEKGVIWGSSNTSVATVAAGSNGTATVSALKAGTAVITAISAADNTKTASCTITVTAAVESLALDQATLSLSVGGDATLSPIFTPGNASNQGVTWKSSNNAIATVIDGVVTAVAPGTATITVTSDADNTKTASCTVTVTQSVNSVGLDPDNITLNVDGTATLSATISPSNASNKDVTWTSSREAVVSVDEHGTITALAVGSAVIHVTTADGGKTAHCTVTVIQPATGVSVSPTSLSLAVGSRDALTAVVSGGATNDSVTWESSAPTVATVNPTTGEVTALAAGQTTITATTTDGSNKSAICLLTVYAPVTAVTIKDGDNAISALTLNMVSKPSAQLSCTTTGGTPDSVVWSSSNNAVMTVDQNGLVTAVGAGSATVTVTATTGGVTKSADCAVTVGRAAFSADKSSLMLLPNNLEGTVSFTCDSDTAITWSGSTNGDVVRWTHAYENGQRVFTFTAVKNGVVVLNWSKAADAKYDGASGSVAITSLVQPITAIDFTNLDTGSSMTASINGSTIRVAGYVGSGSYTLNNKMVFSLAKDVLPNLNASYDPSTVKVTVKDGDTTLLVYNVSLSIVRLPNVTVSSKTTLITPEGTGAGSAEIADATVKDLVKAAAEPITNEVAATSGEKTVTDIKTEISVKQTAHTVDSNNGTNSLTLDITPTYTATLEDGTTKTGTLSEVSADVEITVRVKFRPVLIVHNHNGTLEYPAFNCSGPDGGGYYTVTWTQSSFSTVQLLAADALSSTEGDVAILYPAEMTHVSAMAGKALTFQNNAGVSGYTAYLACYDASGRMLSIQTLRVTGNAASLVGFTPASGTSYVKLFVLGSDGTPLSSVLTIPNS